MQACYCQLFLLIALESTVYSGYADYMGFDDRKMLPGKTFQSIAEAENRTKTNISFFQDTTFVFVPGPVSSALCALKSAAINKQLQSSSCFSTGTCANGMTLVVWLYIPAVLDWNAVGNVTIFTYGRLKVIYGVVNDMRNGTTKPIPSLMFAYTQNDETWLWVSMIHGNSITEAWSHLAITVDSSHDVQVYYNGKPTFVKKSAKVEPAETETANIVTGDLQYMCFDEFVAWDNLQLTDQIKKIYNFSVFGGMSRYIYMQEK